MDIYTFFGNMCKFSVYIAIFWFFSKNIVFAGILALFCEGLMTIGERRAYQIQQLEDRFIDEI
jgi:hypothetical protein